MYIGTEEQRKKRLKELEKLNKESESDPKNNGPIHPGLSEGLGKDPRTVEGQAGSCSNTALLVFS
uniref:Helix-turn-helix domain-containing protein n=1 Tax=Escherichia coli TaxID=562 RepID=A0A3G4RXG5_ECOLX|nr:helix-turn-helix domain-containing protein [Escherichia coli]